MSALIPVRPSMYRPQLNLASSPNKVSAFNVAAVLILFVALWFIASNPAKDSRALTLSNPQAAVASPELIASFVTASSRLGYVTVLGEARNLSSSSLTNVEAVVELLDRKGAVIGVESALIGVKELSPSESTPFSVTLRESIGAASYRIRFRTLMGRYIGSSVSTQ